MLRTLFEIISISCIAFFITTVSGWINLIKHYTGYNRLKPLDCTPCLSFWIALIYCIINSQENIFIIVGIAPVLGWYLENKL
jgi:hypothetical protein